MSEHVKLSVVKARLVSTVVQRNVGESLVLTPDVLYEQRNWIFLLNGEKCLNVNYIVLYHFTLHSCCVYYVVRVV